MMCFLNGPSSAIIDTVKKINYGYIMKKIVNAAVAIIAAAMGMILFLCTQCNINEKKSSLTDDYASFYYYTGGIRKKEVYNVFLSEQRIELGNGSFFILSVHADERLKHEDPKNPEQLLENIIIDMINDTETLYCYAVKWAEEFLHNNISEEELKDKLAVAGLRDVEKGRNTDGLSVKKIKAAALLEFNEYRKIQKKYAAEADVLAKTFIKKALQIDRDFCANNKILSKNAILAQPGVPYRIIDSKEYLLLKELEYPLLGYLLRDGHNRIFNVLPNCAQGATQLVCGYTLYTKASQLAKDPNNSFFKLGNLNQLQAGDIVLVVWDYLADATTNSGHAGVIADVNFTRWGQVEDAVLIEFFPGNTSPRLVNLNSSMYGDWKGLFSETSDNCEDLFFVRLRHRNTDGDPEIRRDFQAIQERLVTLVETCFEKKTNYVIF
jgi:hypothetical protein